MRSIDIAILGGGVSGLSMGYFLKDDREFCVFEAEQNTGGLVSTDMLGNLTFDRGGHFLHFRSPSTRSLLRRLPEFTKTLQPFTRKAGVLHKGEIVTYPFQQHYDQLHNPSKEDRRIARAKGKPKDFQQWIESKFDQYSVREFLVPYNKKFWQVPLSRMAYAWAETFMPDKRSPKKRDGYNKKFYYPQGGIGTLAEALHNAIRNNVVTGKKAVAVSLSGKTIKFSDGETVRYNTLVNTIPLPEFMRIAKARSARVDSLRSTRTVIFNCAGRLEKMHGLHWVYVAEPDTVFYRIGRYTPFLPTGNVNLDTFYVEVSAQGKDPVSALQERMIQDLIKSGFVASRNALTVHVAHDLDYAYPIPLLKTASTVEAIRQQLAKSSVLLLGRFGAWEYWSIEDCLVAARGLAGKLENG